MANKRENTEHKTSEAAASLSTEPSPDVDVELISVSLAVSAGTGFIASQDIALPVRAFAALGFILSTAAAYELYWAYLAAKVPHLTAGAYEGGPLTGLFWLFRQWARLLRAALRRTGVMAPGEYMELGLLNLVVALFLLVAIIAAWVALSMLP